MEAASDPLVALIVGLIGGAVVSMLVGFFVNVNTPRLVAWLAEREKKKQQKKALRTEQTALNYLKLLKTELEQVSMFTSSPSKYHSKLLQVFGSLLRALVAWAGALSAMALYHLIVDIYALQHDFLADTTLLITVAFLIISSLFAANSSAKEFLNITSKVHEFDQYKTRMEQQIAHVSATIEQIRGRNHPYER